MTSPTGPPSLADLIRDLADAAQAYVFRTGEPINTVICNRGHLRAEHSRTDKRGNTVCRACNRDNMRRARDAAKGERS